MGRNILKNGRTAEKRHVRIYHDMMSTPAWRDLSGNAVKLLLHMAKIDNGRINGELGLGVRDAAQAIGVSKNTALAAFEDLEEHGFIRATAKGHFQVKVRVATTWRLTWLPVPDRSGPTHDYKDWAPSSGKIERRSQKSTATVAEIETVTPKHPVTVAEIETVDPIKPQRTASAPVSKFGTHTISHREARSEPDYLAANPGRRPLDPATDDLRAELERIRKSGGARLLRAFVEKHGCDRNDVLGFIRTGQGLPAPALERLQAAVASREIVKRRTPRAMEAL